MAVFIIPYRDRAGHLAQFLPVMIPTAAQMGASILVVEQNPGKPFNRGKLLNIGALEMAADYYILHDVDMIPERADYSAPECPTHIATKCSQFRYKMPFADYFGGVTLFPAADFFTVGGFSNNFWSWGAEDCELRETVKRHGLKIHRRQCTFRSLHHRPADRSLYNENLKLYKAGRQPGDGITNCIYTVTQKHTFNGWQKISVDI